MVRFLAVPLILFSLFIVRSQTVSSNGAIQGTITDPSGAVVASAKVTARNTDSGVVRSAETDANGQFSFVGLSIGMYAIRVDANGFAPVEISAFLLSVGQTVVQKISLQLAGVIGKVEVKEQPDALETTATTTSVAQLPELRETRPRRCRFERVNQSEDRHRQSEGPRIRQRCSPSAAGATTFHDHSIGGNHDAGPSAFEPKLRYDSGRF
jgi:hypothetical protein